MLPIPIGTDRPQRSLPWMNYALILANVACFLLSHAGPHALPIGGGEGGGPFFPWNNYLLDPAHLRLEQFITYQFLHENFSHIFFNMLFLYVFGNNLNEKLGHIGYLAFYLTGGILAGCGQILVSNAPTLGASGAISAVTGLFLVLLPRTNVRMFIWIFVYVDVWEIPSVYFILFSVLKDFLEPLFWGANQTAHAAHLSGNAAGILIGLFLLLTRLVQRDHYDLLASIDRWRRRKQYEALVAGGYDPFRAAPPPPNKSRGKSPAPASESDPRLTSLREKISLAIRDHNLPAAVATYLELRAIDPRHVLPAEEQLDVGNQLMANAQYAHAAAAYEDYLRLYPNSHQSDQVTLILAVIYSHYLPQPTRALELFHAMLPKIHDQKQKAWAQHEITLLTPTPPPPPPPPLR